MPWIIKLALKVLGGMVPSLKYFFQALGFYRHGPMESTNYAIGVFNKHFMRHNIQSKTFNREVDLWESNIEIPKDRIIANCNSGICLELGPGESLLTMMISKAAGFEKTIFVDKGEQFKKDIAPYLEMHSYLKKLGFNIPIVNPTDTIQDLLKKYNSEYLQNGIESLRNLPNQSINFSFSHAVMEHIPRFEAIDFLNEIKRVTKIGGFSSHTIDLKDHIGGSINHLRFSQAAWESEMIYRSGIYTNRLRFSEWTEMFSRCGIDYQIIWKKKFENMPLNKAVLDPQFQTLTNQDLLVCGLDVVFNFSVLNQSEEWPGLTRTSKFI